MRKCKNIQWQTPDVLDWQHASIEVLMDIRDELQTLNRLLGCQNFIDVPNILRRIDANTKKRRKRHPAMRQVLRAYGSKPKRGRKP